MSPELVGLVKSKTRGLKEVTQSQSEPNTRAHTQGSERDLARTVGGEGHGSEREAHGQKAQDAVEGDGVLDHQMSNPTPSSPRPEGASTESSPRIPILDEMLARWVRKESQEIRDREESHAGVPYERRPDVLRRARGGA
jgi:hypothetical protein